jgi:hypothetical protein
MEVSNNENEIGILDSCYISKQLIFLQLFLTSRFMLCIILLHYEYSNRIHAGQFNYFQRHY